MPNLGAPTGTNGEIMPATPDVIQKVLLRKNNVASRKWALTAPGLVCLAKPSKTQQNPAKPSYGVRRSSGTKSAGCPLISTLIGPSVGIQPKHAPTFLYKAVWRPILPSLPLFEIRTSLHAINQPTRLVLAHHDYTPSTSYTVDGSDDACDTRPHILFPSIPRQSTPLSLRSDPRF